MASAGYFYVRNELELKYDSTYKWTERRYKDKHYSILIDCKVLEGRWLASKDTLYLYKREFEKNEKEMFYKFYKRKGKIYYLPVISRDINTESRRYRWRKI